MAVRLSDRFTYKKLLKAVLPSILMMVFTSIYGIVDGLFVSNFVGVSAFTGLNLIMPVLMIISALGFMLGAGGSALVAKTIGEGDEEKANRIFSMVVYFTVILGVVISALVFLFTEPIARWLGGKNATQETLDNAASYCRILLVFQVMYMVQNVFQSFFVAAERATLGFFVTVVAGVANMLLDALFIVGFRWGIVGAAVATGISQTIGALIPIFYFGRKNNSLLRLVKTKLAFDALLKASVNGSSELLSNISMSVMGILYNMQLLKFAGENGVAAYGVIMYAGFIFCAIFIGYGVGVAPIVSYHFGAENHAELKSLLRKSLLITALFSVSMVALTEIFAGALSQIFVGYDGSLKALTARGFRIYGVSFALCGFNIFASGFFTALNDGLISALISFSRTLLFQIIFVFLLPAFWGLDGVWISIAFAELCSVLLSAICFAANRKKYRYA